VWYSANQYSTVTYKSILDFGQNQWTNYLVKMGTLTPPLSPDSFENDNVSTQAKAISTNGTAQSHTLDTAADVDWMKFDAVAGNNYLIAFNSTAGDILDGYLYASSDLNNEIDGGFVGWPILFSCTTGGTYYIAVKSYDSNTGPYSVSVLVDGFSLGQPHQEKPARNDFTIQTPVKK
jgi:hypothetical protein